MLEFRDGDEDIDEDSVEEEQTEKTAKQLKEKQSKKEKKEKKEKKSNGSQEGNEAEKADLELTPTKKAPPISEPMTLKLIFLPTMLPTRISSVPRPLRLATRMTNHILTPILV